MKYLNRRRNHQTSLKLTCDINSNPSPVKFLFATSLNNSSGVETLSKCLLVKNFDTFLQSRYKNSKLIVSIFSIDCDTSMTHTLFSNHNKLYSLKSA